MKTIDLIQYQSNIPFTVLISSIREFYFHSDNKGGGNTIICFLDGTNKIVTQTVDDIKFLINS